MEKQRTGRKQYQGREERAAKLRDPHTARDHGKEGEHKTFTNTRNFVCIYSCIKPQVKSAKTCSLGHLQTALYAVFCGFCCCCCSSSSSCSTNKPYYFNYAYREAAHPRRLVAW